MADPGQQLKKVLAFKRSLEDSRQLFYQGFADENEFRDEVERLLRAFATRKLPKTDAPDLPPRAPVARLKSARKSSTDQLPQSQRHTSTAVRRIFLCYRCNDWGRCV